jgi:hypothetical protein
MADSKHQCLARLDKVELDKLDVIRSSSGLSRSGAIRRLIRDFNLESIEANNDGKFIVEGQISKNIFMQLPIRDIRVEVGSITMGEGLGEIVTFINDEADDSVNVVGFVNCPLMVKPSTRKFYQHDILYWFNSRLYRSISVSWDASDPLPVNRKYYDESVAIFRTTESYLQQIFVV